MKLGKILLVVGVILFVIVAVGGGLIWWNFIAKRVVSLPPATPPPTSTPVFSPLPTSTPANTPTGIPTEAPLAAVVAQTLEIPWSLAFLPDGSIIFTERPGRIRFFDAQKGLLRESLLTISEVVHQGEGGLLGIALHPDFAQNHFIYVYHTYQRAGGLANRVVRYVLNGTTVLRYEYCHRWHSRSFYP